MYQKKESKLCKRCNEPTNRHGVADYCFSCMMIVNTENSRISHKKSNAKRKLKNENK